MTINEQKKEGYITLKEASERFGYAPDYIGQLIRKGKIEGKQVYANVAWMTTAEAIEAYVAKSSGAAAQSDDATRYSFEHMLKELFSPLGARVLSIVLSMLVALLSLLLIVVFYFLSIAIDHSLVRSAEERLSSRVITLDALPPLSPDVFPSATANGEQHE